MRNLSNKSTEYLKCVECQACATLHPFLVHQLHRAYRPARTSRRLPGTKECSWSPSGVSSTSSENGGRTSKRGLLRSSTRFRTSRTKNPSTAHLPYTAPQDRAVLKRAREDKKSIICKANLLAEKDGQFRVRAVSSPPYNRPAHF